MRVNKSEMAQRIRLCLSSLKCGSMDKEERVDRIIHYFARLHGVGVASEETEKDIRYVFVRYPHGQFHETDGDDYATFDIYTDIWLTHTWFREYATGQNVEDILYHIEDSLKITTHWEEYLKEDASSYGFRSYTMIVDDLVPRKQRKHDDSPDAMTYSMSFPRNCGKTNLVTRAMEEYAKRDVEATLNAYKHMLNSIYGTSAFNNGLLDISEVIFNDPATIVLWRDGSKTVVKAQDGETYDPEKGLAMAICKKTMGNTRNYYNVFLKHLKKWRKENSEKKEGAVLFDVVGNKVATIECNLDEEVDVYTEFKRFADEHGLEMCANLEVRPGGRTDTRYRFIRQNGDDASTFALVIEPMVITRKELNDYLLKICKYFYS